MYEDVEFGDFILLRKQSKMIPWRQGFKYRGI